jgi:hypothetical protein
MRPACGQERTSLDRGPYTQTRAASSSTSPASGRTQQPGVRARVSRVEAGVTVTTVRYDGITHDFMMLNPLNNTCARRGAVAQEIAILREALRSG